MRSERAAADFETGDLLVRCLAGRGPGTGDRAPETIDWSRVVDVATREHVAPLLYRRLKESNARSDVPEDAWERIRRAYFTSADRNAHLYRGLRTVLESLRSAGIKVIVLKGAYLAEAVYGDIALRPMCDVDLLVHEDNIERARAVLLGAGGARQQFEDIAASFVRHRHLSQITLGHLVAELHWTITSATDPFSIDDAGLWERARPASIAGVEVLALSPEDLILHLCLHLCHSDWLAGLRPLCDVAEAIHRYGSDTDWAAVAERAREWGAARYVALPLRLAQALLGAEVHDDVIERLVPGGIDPRVLQAATESFVTQTGYGPRVPSYYPSGARSFGDEARWFRNRVFLSRDEMAAKYPASRGSKHFYLYYVLRLRDALRAYPSYARLVARYMMTGLRRSRYAALHYWLKSRK